MTALSRLTSRFFVVMCFILISAVSSIAAERTEQETKNLQTVVEFYQKALNDMNDEGMLAYLGDTYINHNPNVADGRDAFKQYIIDRRSKNPDAKSEIKASFVEGDYVILHVHTVREPGTRGNAVIDIFRLDNGKIVEHWDAVQPIPEKAANNNTMF